MMTIISLGKQLDFPHISASLSQISTSNADFPNRLSKERARSPGRTSLEVTASINKAKMPRTDDLRGKEANSSSEKGAEPTALGSVVPLY